jgi:hypothetical protein
MLSVRKTRRYRIIMAVGAALAVIPLRQLLKKDPKQGADGAYSIECINRLDVSFKLKEDAPSARSFAHLPSAYLFALT